MKILILGGCGFVGSNLALAFKKDFADFEICAFDNLKRRGSELNIARLKAKGIRFIHGDIRIKSDLFACGAFNLVLDCSAEPSVIAGMLGDDPSYLLETNLLGTINCLNYVKETKAALLFLSTSRVYPIQKLNNLAILETETRFTYKDFLGVSEDFSLKGYRSLYGATKLASEHLIEEYVNAYNLKALINRCSVLCGPWQFAKVDQGFVSLFAMAYAFNKPLSFIGYNGSGKQVRDILHIKDLYALVKKQILDINHWQGQVYNVGGGYQNSISLLELSKLCQKISNKAIPIEKVLATRPNDLAIFYMNNQLVNKTYNWQVTIGIEAILKEIFNLLKEEQASLKKII